MRVEEREGLKKIYKLLKLKTASGVTFGILLYEGLRYVRDASKAKVKVYVITLLLGPYLQAIGGFLYVATKAIRVRRIAIIINAFGAQIMSGHLGMYNLGWIWLDLLLFGEIVPIVKYKEIMLLGHEISSFD
jgi:hypothetical protein